MNAHVCRPERHECAWCGETWPCEVQDLRDDARALRDEVKTLRAEVQRSQPKRRLAPGERAMLAKLVDLLGLFYGEQAGEARLGIQTNGGMSVVIVPPARDLLTSLLLERARLALTVAEVRS